MRMLALLANAGVLAFVGYLTIANGLPTDADDVVPFLLFIAIPGVSIAALLQTGGVTSSWLGLFLERKRLEEQSRIAKLKDSSTR